MCLGCARYEVSATLVGRLDGVADAAIKRDNSGKIVALSGFGNMNAYPRAAGAAIGVGRSSEGDRLLQGRRAYQGRYSGPPAQAPGARYPIEDANRESRQGTWEPDPAGEQAAEAVALFPKPKGAERRDRRSRNLNEAAPTMARAQRIRQTAFCTTAGSTQDHLSGNALVTRYRARGPARSRSAQPGEGRREPAHLRDGVPGLERGHY